jgi:hypothetical protein
VVVYASFTNKRFEEDEMLAVRSSDGGTTFSAPTQVALLQAVTLRGFRAPSLPATAVDRAGRLYLVWEDCRFSALCTRNDLVLSTSADGVAWSDPVRVPTTAAGSSTHSLVPGIGVDPATAGAAAHVAIVYYTFRPDLALDVATISSNDGGATWGTSQRLNVEPMDLSWIAETGDGAMVGDYVALSYAGGRAIPIFSLASQPAADGTLRQSIFARKR